MPEIDATTPPQGTNPGGKMSAAIARQRAFISGFASGLREAARLMQDEGVCTACKFLTEAENLERFLGDEPE